MAITGILETTSGSGGTPEEYLPLFEVQTYTAILIHTLYLLVAKGPICITVKHKTNWKR